MFEFFLKQRLNVIQTVFERYLKAFKRCLNSFSLKTLKDAFSFFHLKPPFRKSGHKFKTRMYEHFSDIFGGNRAF